MVYCPYCGVQREPHYKVCPNCGGAFEAITQPAEKASVSAPGANLSLFEGQRFALIINWAFPNLKNALIFDANGQKIGEISRNLSEYGIDYQIIDAATNETLSIEQYTETNFHIKQNGNLLPYEIEKRKVLEQLQLKNPNGPMEYMTEAEDFISKKSVYQDDEDHEVAGLYRLKENDIPKNFTPLNSYILKIKTANLNLRKILVLLVNYLSLYKVNPYR